MSGGPDCPPGPEAGPFRLDVAIDWPAFCRALEAAEYCEPVIAERVGIDDSGRPLDMAALLRRTADPTPLNTLVRLFVLGCPVPHDQARAAVAPARVEGLVAVGLLAEDSGGVRAQVSLMPTDDVVMAGELHPQFSGRAISRQHVLGVGTATRAAANLTVRRPAELALDLGTGSGYLALLAARHARRVIGTDINARALSFAAFNARLNGAAHLELRRGSLFEPVENDRFDLIISNPPFAMAPRAEYEYRDSGMPGDAICERIVREAPGRLRPGGFATIVCNWHHTGDGDWADRPSRWVSDSSCDAWIICFEMTDLVGYAASWLRVECEPGSEEYARQMERWLSYLEGLGARRISFGAVVLRRRAAERNWIRADVSPSGWPSRPCAEQIERIFAAQDLLEEVGPAGSLLDMAFALAPWHELEQTLHAEDGRWVVQRATLTQTQGFPFVGNVDRHVTLVLAGCDGRRKLGEIVANMAKGLGVPPEQLAPAVSKVVRTFLRWGFLTVPTP